MTNTIVTAKIDVEDDEKCARGFEERRVDGKRIVGHSGCAPIMNANFDMYWDSGYAVIVLCNVDSPIARQVNRSGNESGSDAAPSLTDGYNQARTELYFLA